MESLENALKSLKTLEKGLSEGIEQELVMLRSLNKDIKAEVDSRGFATYSLGKSGLVIATIHNGTYVPEDIHLRQDEQERKDEVDLFTGELYLPIFLENGGVWITSHVDRHFVDLNRPMDTAILSYNAPDENGNLVATDNGNAERKAKEHYAAFYATAISNISKSKFLFSGHSMDPEKNGKKRGDICLIYKTPQEGKQLKGMLQQEFEDVRINDPFRYEGGNFRVFTDHLVRGNSVEFETNKRLYLDGSKKSDQFSDVSRKISSVVTDYLRNK